MVTNTLKKFITWDLKDKFLLCEALALFLQVKKIILNSYTITWHLLQGIKVSAVKKGKKAL